MNPDLEELSLPYHQMTALVRFPRPVREAQVSPFPRLTFGLTGPAVKMQALIFVETDDGFLQARGTAYWAPREMDPFLHMNVMLRYPIHSYTGTASKRPGMLQKFEHTAKGSLRPRGRSAHWVYQGNCPAARVHLQHSPAPRWFRDTALVLPPPAAEANLALHDVSWRPMHRVVRDAFERAMR